MLTITETRVYNLFDFFIDISYWLVLPHKKYLSEMKENQIDSSKTYFYNKVMKKKGCEVLSDREN